MFRSLLQRLAVALTLLAFVSGMTLQLMPPKSTLAAAPLPAMGDCEHMVAPAKVGSSHTMPCKGIDPECVKQMGCLGTASLPLPPRSPATFFSYRRVAYWLPAEVFAGRSIKPDLLPPIGL